MAQDRSTVSRFGSAFAWLLAREVSAERIAALFATKAGTVRVAAHRWRKAEAVQSGDWPTITAVPTARGRRSIGIRQGFDEVIATSRRRISLELLETRILSIVESHRADYQFSVAPAAQREMERWRSTASECSAPLGRGFSRHKGLPIRCSSGKSAKGKPSRSTSSR